MQLHGWPVLVLGLFYGCVFGVLSSMDTSSLLQLHAMIGSQDMFCLFCFDCAAGLPSIEPTPMSWAAAWLYVPQRRQNLARWTFNF